MKRRPVPGLFNARLRGQIIRTIARCGEYRGHKGTQEFAIYRGQEGVILLLEQGKRWKTLPAINVFDACETIEALERKSRYASMSTSTDEGADLAEGSRPAGDAGHEGKPTAPRRRSKAVAA